MIKKGDLVIVVSPRKCCGGGNLGDVFTVSKMKATTSRCSWCGHKQKMVIAGADHHIRDGYNVDRLKKIDPPSEGETREAYVNLKQPRKVTA